MISARKITLKYYMFTILNNIAFLEIILNKAITNGLEIENSDLFVYNVKIFHLKFDDVKLNLLTDFIYMFVEVSVVFEFLILSKSRYQSVIIFFLLSQIYLALNLYFLCVNN